MSRNLKLIFRQDVYDAPRIYIPGEPFRPIVLSRPMAYYALVDNVDLYFESHRMKEKFVPIKGKMPGLRYRAYAKRLQTITEKYIINVYAIADLAVVAEQVSLPLEF